LPTQHDRQAVVGDEEPRGKIRGTLHFDHIGFALRSFRLSDIRVGDGEARGRAREHAEQQTREILLRLHHARAQHHLLLLRRRRGHARTRRRRNGTRDQYQRVANESRRHGTGVLRGKFIAARILVGQLGLDLEFDWDEVLAANLAGAAGDDEGLDGGDLRSPPSAARAAASTLSAVLPCARPGAWRPPIQIKTNVTLASTDTNRRIGAGSFEVPVT
jgi:hypothetical protein